MYCAVKIDSWDSETATVTVNGKPCGRSTFNHNRGTQKCGVNHGSYVEQKSRFTCFVPAPAGSVLVKVATNINENARNEAWGIDNVRITTGKRSELSGTTLFEDTFEGGCDGWTPCARSSCGGFGKMLGGHGIAGSGYKTTKTYKLGGKYETATIKFAYVKIGSWDNEEAWVKVNGKKVWKRNWIHHAGTEQCGVNHCGHTARTRTQPPLSLKPHLQTSMLSSAQTLTSTLATKHSASDT